MAKKKAAGDFNMTGEIRNLLRANSTLTGREVHDTLVKNFPKQRINEASCHVAFSKTRQLLGISQGLRKKMAKKKVVRKKRPSVATTTVDLATLQAAAKFVAQIGSAETAIAAIKQLQTVQIG